MPDNTIAMSFSCPNYSGLLYTKSNTDTPFLNAIGGALYTTHTEFATSQDYTLEEPSQPAISEAESAKPATASFITRKQKTNVTKLSGVAKAVTGIAGGLAADATSGTLLYNGIKNLITGTGDLANNFNLLKAGVGVAGIAISGFIALGNPVGAIITGVVAGIGAIAGVVKGLDEKTQALNDAMAASILYDNGGTKISEIATAFNDWADAATAVNNQTIDKYKLLD